MPEQPEQFVRRSNAKINLALRITGRRADGYHTISTLFQEIDFHDKIYFKEANQFSFTTNTSELPTDSSNLCVAAYETIMSRRENKKPLKIHLEKNIPIGAGLGGGSSNAATVIRFLNTYWNIGLSYQEMKDMGKELGADVPFFIKGGTQIGEGIGEILKPVRIEPNFKILCIIPDFNISTIWAYKNFSLTNKKDKFNFDRLILGNKPNWKLFENQFEEIVTQSYPEISDMKRKLLGFGAEYAGLSGSGSTVIGVFHKDADLTKLEERIDYVTVITNPLIN